MSYKRKNKNIEVGDTVILTKKVESCAGYFEINSIVKVIDIDPNRGYSFEDEYGNRIIETGWGNCIPYDVCKFDDDIPFYEYSGSNPNEYGSGFVKLNGYIILHAESKDGKEFLKEAVELFNGE
jgi:hypothetical protein